MLVWEWINSENGQIMDKMVITQSSRMVDADGSAEKVIVF
jgi:hypothetical protein